MAARFFLLVAVSFGLRAGGWAEDVSIERADRAPAFVIENAEVTDLSGLTWTGGDSFHAVADHPNLLVPLTLKIDRESGCITHGEMGTPIPVRASVSDFEGVTYVAATKTFFISAETGNAVISYQPG